MELDAAAFKTAPASPVVSFTAHDSDIPSGVLDDIASSKSSPDEPPKEGGAVSGDATPSTDELLARLIAMEEELQATRRANDLLRDAAEAHRVGLAEAMASGTHARSSGHVPQRLTEKRKHMNNPPVYDPKNKTSLTDWEAIMSTYLREGEFPEADWVAIANTYLAAHLQRALFMDVQAIGKRISDFLYAASAAAIKAWRKPAA